MNKNKQTNKQKISSLFALTEVLARQVFLQSRAHHVLCNIHHLYTLRTPRYSSRQALRAEVGNTPCKQPRYSICCVDSKWRLHTDSIIALQRFFLERSRYLKENGGVISMNQEQLIESLLRNHGPILSQQLASCDLETGNFIVFTDVSKTSPKFIGFW